MLVFMFSVRVVAKKVWNKAEKLENRTEDWKAVHLNFEVAIGLFEELEVQKYYPETK